MSDSRIQQRKREKPLKELRQAIHTDIDLAGENLNALPNTHPGIHGRNPNTTRPRLSGGVRLCAHSDNQVPISTHQGRPEVGKLHDKTVKEEILTVEDPLEDEHWQFVLSHPAFAGDLAGLREDLDHAYDFPSSADLALAALSAPGAADYPALSLSEKWGIPPAAIIRFAYTPPEKIAELRPEAIKEFRQEAHGLVVSENPVEFVVRIPRPMTKAKREKIAEWVGNAPDDGPLEHAWARVGKKESLSPALVEGLPWFERWNREGVEPVKIWRDLTAPDGEYSVKMLSERSVYDRILNIWKRMKSLSPEGIRPDKPSQRRG